jgi:hypothetical protein
MLSEPNEQPVYVLPLDKKRVLIPKIVSLLVLGIIFYLGVLLNINLLKLKATEDTIIQVIALIFVLTIIILGTFLSYKQAKTEYAFYRNHLTGYKKDIPYQTIIKVDIKQNILDKAFRTYSLDLGSGKIEYIPNAIQIQDYVQQLVSYSRSNVY